MRAESSWRGLQVIRIQPDEAIYLKINNKIPGLGLHLDVTKLDLTYRERFEVAHPLRGLVQEHMQVQLSVKDAPDVASVHKQKPDGTQTCCTDNVSVLGRPSTHLMIDMHGPSASRVICPTHTSG